MKSFVYCVLLFAATMGYAQEERLVCNVNRSESYVIKPNARKVEHILFLQKETELELASFNVYRCPGCYSFEGTSDGVTYAGVTEGIRGENGWEYTLKLKINGEEQKDIRCFIH